MFKFPFLWAPLVPIGLKVSWYFKFNLELGNSSCTSSDLGVLQVVHAEEIDHRNTSTSSNWRPDQTCNTATNTLSIYVMLNVLYFVHFSQSVNATSVLFTVSDSYCLMVCLLSATGAQVDKSHHKLLVTQQKVIRLSKVLFYISIQLVIRIRKNRIAVFFFIFSNWRRASKEKLLYVSQI